MTKAQLKEVEKIVVEAQDALLKLNLPVSESNQLDSLLSSVAETAEGMVDRRGL